VRRGGTWRNDPTSKRRCGAKGRPKLEGDAARLHDGGFDGKVRRSLTACPAACRGWARFEDTSEVQADYLGVELAHITARPQRDGRFRGRATRRLEVELGRG